MRKIFKNNFKNKKINIFSRSFKNLENQKNQIFGFLFFVKSSSFPGVQDIVSCTAESDESPDESSDESPGESPDEDELQM